MSEKRELAGYLGLEHPRNVNLLEAVGAFESVRRIHRDVIHHIIQSDIPGLAVITLADLFKRVVLQTPWGSSHIHKLTAFGREIFLHF